MQDAVVTTNKVPLGEAAEVFASICNAIDEGNLNEEILTLFNSARVDLVASIDRRICFLDILRSAIKSAEENKDAWKQRFEQLKFVKERVDSITIEALRSSGLTEFKGNIGRLCMQNNPEALSLEFETYTPHVSNVVDPATIERFAIPEKYVKKFAAYQIDKALVKEDLQAGQELSWARLTRGVQLRSRK